MKVLVVQLVDHALRVGIVEVPLHLAHRHPPEPVLHDVVHRNVQSAILRRNALNLCLRLILVLALPEAVGPPAEERHIARQFAIVPDNLVGLGTVQEVVVDAVCHFRGQVKRMYKLVIRHGTRRIVPEDPVTTGRNQQRNCDLGVFLPQRNRLAAVVPHPRLVLPRPYSPSCDP